jgi:hypothetical protein
LQALNWPINSLYTKVDDVLLLGSLPATQDVPALAKARVKHVINMCSEWWGPQAAYR